MKFLKKYAGMALIFMGVCMLAALYAAHLTFVGWLLLTGLLLILAGLMVHVWVQKRDSRY